MEPVLAVYDACVLYPAPLRDLLLHLACVGLVRPRWTDAIHEEWTRNLLANRPVLARAQLERTRALIADFHGRENNQSSYGCQRLAVACSTQRQ